MSIVFKVSLVGQMSREINIIKRLLQSDYIFRKLKNETTKKKG